MMKISPYSLFSSLKRRTFFKQSSGWTVLEAKNQRKASLKIKKKKTKNLKIGLIDRRHVLLSNFRTLMAPNAIKSYQFSLSRKGAMKLLKDHFHFLFQA